MPSEQSVQIALRTQQLIAYESGAADTADPLGGSFYIEKLTDEIEKRAQEYIDKIDSMGGSVAAVEKGYIQQEIQESAYRYQKEIESGDRVIVGVNQFQTKEPPPKGLLKVDPKVREVQIKRLAELKASRDSQRVKDFPGGVEENCPGGREFDGPDLELCSGLLHFGRDLRCPAGSVRGV